MRMTSLRPSAPAARGADDDASSHAPGECRCRGWSRLIKIMIIVAVVLHEVGGIRARSLDSIHRLRRWCNAVDRSRVRVRDRYRVEPVPSALTPRERRARISDFAPEGPGRVTPHPILGWDCGRAGMPTARSTARSTGTVYRTWSYLRGTCPTSLCGPTAYPLNQLSQREPHTPQRNSSQSSVA